MRINRFLASAGFGSRRGVEELIREGRVTVNGVVCPNLATEIAPEDKVKVDGRPVATQSMLYVLLNKPKGTVCTASDERGRRTVFDSLPREWPRLFHVGRLDKESEGLLILTNDGDFALKLTHPRYKVEKEYLVTLDRACEPKHVSELLRGIFIESGRARAERIVPVGAHTLSVVLRQGLKRQVRLMFSTLGYSVKRLRRVRIGNLKINRVPLGGWRVLSRKEVDALLAQGESPSGSPAGSPDDPRPRRSPRPSPRPDRPSRGASPQGSRRPPRSQR